MSEETLQTVLKDALDGKFDDMTLPNGYSCGDCYYWKRCKSMISSLTGHETKCDFSPSQFMFLSA